MPRRRARLMVTARSDGQVRVCESSESAAATRQEARIGQPDGIETDRTRLARLADSQVTWLPRYRGSPWWGLGRGQAG